VTVSLPRYSYWLYSSLVGPQWLEYFNDQCAFVEHLPNPIRNAIVVRLYPEDYGWDQKSRWRERFPELELEHGESRIEDLIARSRLYISTYNGTTFLESIALDVPTVIYWKEQHWELRESASRCFEDLKRVGVFHSTPESAARHVAQIWDDVAGWWSSSDVQEVCTAFKRRYCDSPPALLRRIAGKLNEAVAAAPARH